MMPEYGYNSPEVDAYLSQPGPEPEDWYERDAPTWKFFCCEQCDAVLATQPCDVDIDVAVSAEKCPTCSQRTP